MGLCIKKPEQTYCSGCHHHISNHSYKYCGTGPSRELYNDKVYKYMNCPKCNHSTKHSYHNDNINSVVCMVNTNKLCKCDDQCHVDAVNEYLEYFRKNGCTCTEFKKRLFDHTCVKMC